MEKEKKPRDHLLYRNGKQWLPKELMLFHSTWCTICDPSHISLYTQKIGHNLLRVLCTFKELFGNNNTTGSRRHRTIQRDIMTRVNHMHNSHQHPKEVESSTTFSRSYLIDFARCRGNQRIDYNIGNWATDVCGTHSLAKRGFGDILKSLIKLFTSETLTNKPQGGTVQLSLTSHLPVTVWNFSHSVIRRWLI